MDESELRRLRRLRVCAEGLVPDEGGEFLFEESNVSAQHLLAVLLRFAEDEGWPTATLQRDDADNSPLVSRGDDWAELAPIPDEFRTWVFDSLGRQLIGPIAYRMMRATNRRVVGNDRALVELDRGSHVARPWLASVTANQIVLKRIHDADAVEADLSPDTDGGDAAC